MPHYLHADFLESETAFAAAEAFWLRLVAEATTMAPGVADWKSWYPRTYADGVTPIAREHRAVYESRSETLLRSIQVLQEPPSDGASDEAEICAWLAVNQSANREPAPELVISLVLSSESADVARELVRRWMSPRVTEAAMAAIIAELAPPRGATD